MKLLKVRLFDKMLQEQQTEIAKTRKGMVGSGDRSEKIRTYNFPDHRVTDHRIGFTSHQLPKIMDGDMDELTEALMKAEAQETLS